MTRILMHPQTLPRFTGSRVQLCDSWQWWRTRMYPGTDGNLFHQQYDDERDIREASILCLDGQDVEIVDPPSLRIIMEMPDYHDIPYSARELLTVCYESPRWAECDVVWHTQPGPHWFALPGNTCLLGEYMIHQVSRRERQRLDDSSMRLHFSSGMPTLRMSQDRGLQEMTAAWGLLAHGGRRLPAVMMTPNEARRYEGLPEVVDWAGNLIGVLNDHPMPTPLRGGRTPRSPNVKPESEVIDEIDRLVNDQVRMGPVDDYNADRYPKCKVCKHNLHGLDCEHCGCINTDWLKG